MEPAPAMSYMSLFLILALAALFIVSIKRIYRRNGRHGSGLGWLFVIPAMVIGGLLLMHFGGVSHHGMRGLTPSSWLTVVIGLVIGCVVLLLHKNKTARWMLMALLLAGIPLGVGMFFLSSVRHQIDGPNDQRATATERPLEIVQLRPPSVYDTGHVEPLTEAVQATVWSEGLANEFYADIYPSPEAAARGLGNKLLERLPGLLEKNIWPADLYVYGEVNPDNFSSEILYAFAEQVRQRHDNDDLNIHVESTIPAPFPPAIPPRQTEAQSVRPAAKPSAARPQEQPKITQVRHIDPEAFERKMDDFSLKMQELKMELSKDESDNPMVYASQAIEQTSQMIQMVGKMMQGMITNSPVRFIETEDPEEDRAKESVLPEPKAVPVAAKTEGVLVHPVHVRLGLNVQTSSTRSSGPYKPFEERSGSLTMSVYGNGGERVLSHSLKFTEKQWVENWAGFINSRPGENWIIGRSSSSCVTEEAARQQALQDACAKLEQQVREHVNRIGGVTRITMDKITPAMLQRSREDLVEDRFAQSFYGSAGPIWREAVLVNASQNNLNSLVHDIRMQSDEAAAQVRTQRRNMVGKMFSVGGMLGVICVLYIFLNFATRGYYSWALRIGALLVVGAGICAVLLLT